MREELLKGLSEEQIAKVKACKNQEELLALAKEENIELTEEQLEVVNGGGCYPSQNTYAVCHWCHSDNVEVTGSFHDVKTGGIHYRCRDCGKTWNAPSPFH